MKSLNKYAAGVFNTILGRLAAEGDEHIKIDNTDGAFMPLCVNRLSKDKVALSHYGEQNGDLMADPDMVFWISPDGQIIPCSLQNDYAGIYHSAVNFRDSCPGDNGYSFPATFSSRMQADLASFANTWLRNIKQQQGI